MASREWEIWEGTFGDAVAFVQSRDFFFDCFRGGMLSGLCAVQRGGGGSNGIVELRG